MATKYRAVAGWTPGVEAVESQRYSWTVAGALEKEGELPPTAKTRDSADDEILVDPGEAVVFSVRSANQGGESQPLVISNSAPVPAPDAPTNGTMSFVPVEVV